MPDSEIVFGPLPEMPKGAFLEAEERAEALAVEPDSLLTDFAGDEVEAVEVEDGTGRRLRFHIKKLSPSEIMSTEAKRYRVEHTGAIKRNLESEAILGTRAELLAAVVKNQGSDETPQWVPYFKQDQLFKVETIKGIEKRTGLMTMSKSRTLLDNLSNEVWRVNPIFNPLERAKQAGMIQGLNASPESSPAASPPSESG